MRRILVIRYGGFGDMILSMAAFRTIRAHHPAGRVSVLTTRRFADLLRQSGYFDQVLIDDRLKPWQLAGWLRQARVLRETRFDRVYDLQRNERTAVLYRVMTAGRGLEWSGGIRGSSHYLSGDRGARRHMTPGRGSDRSGVILGPWHYVRDDPGDRRHIPERLAEQLAVAGIPEMLP